MTDLPDHNEFTCTGCGRLIVSLPRIQPPPTKCATCMWLDEFVTDPKERAELRRKLCEMG